MTEYVNSENLKNVLSFIKDHKTFLVCSHINPDGDALGTTLGLGLALRELGKDVTLYNVGPIAYNLHFLPHVDQVLFSIPEDKSFDATIIVDCGSLKRLGSAFQTFRLSGKAGILICVDHHASNPGFGGLDLIESHISSSGEVASCIIRGFRHPFSPAVATALFCALMTDTGSFRYDNARSQTFHLAAQLVEAGAKPKEIAEHLYANRPKHYFYVVKDVLDTLQLHPHLPIAWMHVTRDVLEQYGYEVDVLEGLIEEIRSLESCEVAIFYKENIDRNGYKLSTRSKNYIDVAQVCATFGGGGHKRASGVDMKGSLEHIHAQILAEVEKQFAQHRQQQNT